LFLHTFFARASSNSFAFIVSFLKVSDGSYSTMANFAPIRSAQKWVCAATYHMFASKMVAK
jgi:hypothetical protein